MNSKELLEQAKKNAHKQLELADQIEKAEQVLDKVKGGEIGFYIINYGFYRINEVTDPEKLEVIKDLGLTAIMNYRDDKSKELEQLLGIQPVPEPSPLAQGGVLVAETSSSKYFEVKKEDDALGVIIPDRSHEIRKPATINTEFEALFRQDQNQLIITPEFEKAAQEMDQRITQPDPVEETLSNILDKQEQEIKDSGKSIEQEAKDILGIADDTGYPAPKKNGRKKLPENMTEKAVYTMLMVEKKKPKEIAAHYNLTNTQVSNFIFQHDIKNYGKRNRLPRAEKADKPDKQPEETERP